MIVDAHHDVQGARLHRRGDDHLAHAGGEVGLERLGRAELAAAFEDDVDAVRAPGTAPGVVALENATRVPSIDALRDCRRRRSSRPPAVHRVERQQVGRRLGTAGDFVDVDELEVGRPQPARSASRPMRPKPLMPMRMPMFTPWSVDCARQPPTACSGVTRKGGSGSSAYERSRLVRTGTASETQQVCAVGRSPSGDGRQRPVLVFNRCPSRFTASTWVSA